MLLPPTPKSGARRCPLNSPSTFVTLPPMFDEPSEGPTEQHVDPATQAREKADEFRMHAELAAVFEGTRKFDAQLRPDLDPDIARNVQRTMGRLEKSRPADSPIIPSESAPDAAALLDLPNTRDLTTN